MADFPINPIVGQVYVSSDFTNWVWDGTAWKATNYGLIKLPVSQNSVGTILANSMNFVNSEQVLANITFDTPSGNANVQFEWLELVDPVAMAIIFGTGSEPNKEIVAGNTDEIMFNYSGEIRTSPELTYNISSNTLTMNTDLFVANGTTGNVGIGTIDSNNTLEIVTAPSNKGGLTITNFSEPNAYKFKIAVDYDSDAPYRFYTVNDIMMQAFGRLGDKVVFPNGNFGINTFSPVTVFHVNDEVIDDAAYAYDSNTAMIVHQVPTTSTDLNDPKEVLLLARQGTVAQAYGAAATFDLSRYANEGVGSRTRLDLKLAHNDFLKTNTTVITLLSSGNVGIGITNPQANLHVFGNAIISGLDIADHANAAYLQANTAYDQANTAYDQANDAYDAANTSANTVTIHRYGTLLLSKANINFVNNATSNANVVANGTTQANITFDVNPSAINSMVSATFTTINSTFGTTNSTFGTINSTFGTTNSTFGTINSTFATVNTASSSGANTARVSIRGSYLFAGFQGATGKLQLNYSNTHPILLTADTTAIAGNANINFQHAQITGVTGTYDYPARVAVNEFGHVTGVQGGSAIAGAQGAQGATGVAGGLIWTFDTSTSAAPAVGRIRFSSAAIGSVTSVWINESANVDSGTTTASFAGYMNTWDDSTNPILGYLEITSENPTDTTYAVFSVTAIADPGAYKTLTVTGGVGTLPSNGERLVVRFLRAGDVGSQGVQGAQGLPGSGSTTPGPTGRAGGLIWTFDGTAGGTPAVGRFRFNTGTFGSVASVLISENANVDSSTTTASFAGYMNTWGTGTGSIKGYLEITSEDPTDTTYALFVVTNVADSGTYQTLTVNTPTGAAPSAGERCIIRFLRAGDTGAQGVQGSQGEPGTSGTGSGTVSSGTTPYLAYYSSTGTVVDDVLGHQYVSGRQSIVHEKEVRMLSNIADTPVISGNQANLHATENTAGRVYITTGTQAGTGVYGQVINCLPAVHGGYSFTVVRGAQGTVRIGTQGGVTLYSSGLPAGGSGTQGVQISRVFGAATILANDTNKVIIFGDIENS